MTKSPEQLTFEERTCLQLAARGQSVDLIAQQLQADHEKVETDLESARRKLMANTTVEAVARALKLGLIE